MSGPTADGLWLDAFPRVLDAEHERTARSRSSAIISTVVYYPGARRDGGSDGTWLRVVPRGAEPWTAVFSSDNLPGRLNVVSSWPDPERIFVAAGGAPYLVHAGDPDDWSRIDRTTVRHFEPVSHLALLLDDEVLSAYDGRGLAWESDPVPGSHWLGLLDGEVHLRAGDLVHRIDLRHGRTTTEPVSW